MELKGPSDASVGGDGDRTAGGKGTPCNDIWWQKAGKFLGKVELEPIMAFYSLATSVSGAFIQNVIIEKVCLETAGLTREVCDHVHTNATLEVQVQRSAAQYLMSMYLLRLIPAILLSVAIGHWSDVHGRKRVLVFALCGNVITYALYLLNAVLIEVPAIYMVLAAIPAGLCGDYAIMMFGLYSIIRDRTSLADLAVKIAIIDGIETISYEIGPLIGVQLYTHFGYVAVLVASIVLLICGVLYTAFRINEPQFGATDWRHSIKNLVNVQSLFMNLSVLTVKREGHQRAYLLANMLCAVMFSLCTNGSSEIIYLYGRLVVEWDVVVYSYFSILTGTLQAIGFLIILPVVLKVFRMTDIGLLLIGITTTGVAYFGSAFVRNLSEMFAARCMGTFVCFVFVSLRSITMKIVSATEAGKTTGMFSIAQTLGQILGRIFATQIYVATLSTFPGTYFVYCSGMCVVITIIYGIMYWDVKKSKDIDI